jgi:hypothetical protein
MARSTSPCRRRPDGPMPWVALVLVAVATACSHVAGAVMWKEAPSLPLSRRFHVAASDCAGAVYAFGGVVQLYPESPRHGLGGEFGMVILDPSAGAWRVGPRHPWFRYISRMERRTYRAGTFGEPPVEVGISESEGNRGPSHEMPPGTGGRDGRIYWFAPPGPIIFDPDQGTWTQPPPSGTRRTLAVAGTHLVRRGVTASAPDEDLSGGGEWLYTRSREACSPA